MSGRVGLFRRDTLLPACRLPRAREPAVLGMRVLGRYQRDRAEYERGELGHHHRDACWLSQPCD